MSQVQEAPQRKDFYKILGVARNASPADIQAAYQKLAADNHPEKNTDNRVEAQRKFNEITEAYFVLSDPARRSQYDELAFHRFEATDAEKTFLRFFNEKGLQSEEEREFFQENFPDRPRSYYEILNVPRNATLPQIQSAYRKLALKYHPKTNPSKDAERRFLEISEAYHHLSDALRRRDYDDTTFGEILPFMAHDIFNNFNRSRFFDSLNLVNLAPETESAESVRQTTYYKGGPQGREGRTVTSKSVLENGRRKNVQTEEILKPDGSREIIETVNDAGNISSSKYTLAPGQTERKAVKN